MMVLREGVKVASGIVEGLRAQPLALALVVINVLYLGVAVWFLSLLSDRAAANDAFLLKLIQRDDCKGPGSP